MTLRRVTALAGIVLIVFLIAGLFLRSSLAGVAIDDGGQAQRIPVAPDDDGFAYLPVTPNDYGSPTSTPGPQPSPTPTRAIPGGVIVVDHTSVDDFERIPDQYIEAAENLRMLFIDRSVGDNISQGLDCLAFPSDEEAPTGCKKYDHAVPEFNTDPEELNWSRPGGYSRGNWVYQFWPDECGGWYAFVPCVEQVASPVMNQYDVFSPQFSYLEVAPENIEGSIADPQSGFFSDNAEENDVYDLEAFIAQHPDKTFIFATTSVARSVGTEVSESFNNQMRDYAIANGHVLFDIADILGHDHLGNPCYDNRDGVPYDNGNQSENYPDDGLALQAICQHYTVETNGGHLGNPSVGKIRIAKAFWVLMARIAGWDGVSE